MARTFLGELVLTLRQNLTAEAGRIKTASNEIDAALERMASQPWGSKFAGQLDSLRLVPSELEKVKASWNNLFGDMKANDLNTVLQRQNFGDWKNAVLGHFASVRAEMDEQEARTKRFAESIRNTMAPVLGMLGYGGAGLVAYSAGREGFDAALKRGHERYLEQNNSGVLSVADRVALQARAMDLSARFPSVSATSVMEMGRVASVAMGSTQLGMDALPDLVRMRVLLGSSMGQDTGEGVMANVMRALELSGKTQGPMGLAQSHDILEGMAKALEVHGADLFDPGSMLTFIRTAKQAAPALSTEFLSLVAPALVQDLGAPKAGTQLSSAFKAFALGDTQMSGKKYRTAQAAYGIRDGANGDLVDAHLYGEDPYAWTLKYLLPALAKHGVNLDDDTALSLEIGRLSSNSNATSFLSQIVTKRSLFAKWISQALGAPGFAAADTAASRDPVTAFAALQSSFDNFAAAVADKTDIIVPGLNKLTAALNAMAAWVEKNPTPAVLAAGASLGVAGFAAWKGATGLMGLVTAGPALNEAAINLNAAAVALEGAATAQGGGNVLSDVENAIKSGAPVAGGFSLWALGQLALKATGIAGAIAYAAHSTPVNADETGDHLAKVIPGYKDAIAPYLMTAEQAEGREEWAGSFYKMLADRVVHQTANMSGSPDDRAEREGDLAIAKMKAGLGGLGAPVTLNVDTSALDRALGKVNALRAGLRSIGDMTGGGLGLDRSFADRVPGQ